MQSLERIFRASYLKGDGSRPSHGPEVSSMHASALMSWSLLLSVAPAHVVSDYLKRLYFVSTNIIFENDSINALMYNQFSHLHKLPQLLESPNVDLRVAAGETIALFYELSRSNSQVRSALLIAYIYLCKIVYFCSISR